MRNRARRRWQPPGVNGPSVDAAAAVRELLAMVRGSRIAELEVEWEGGSIRLHREPPPVAPPNTPAAGPPTLADHTLLVRSGYVGVFYRDPDQELPGPGDVVAEGATLAEVETLGIRNRVVVPSAGILDELLVEDATPVEYGQPLAVIRVHSAEP